VKHNQSNQTQTRLQDDWGKTHRKVRKIGVKLTEKLDLRLVHNSKHGFLSNTSQMIKDWRCSFLQELNIAFSEPQIEFQIFSLRGRMPFGRVTAVT